MPAFITLLDGWISWLAGWLNNDQTHCLAPACPPASAPWLANPLLNWLPAWLNDDQKPAPAFNSSLSLQYRHYSDNGTELNVTFMAWKKKKKKKKNGQLTNSLTNKLSAWRRITHWPFPLRHWGRRSQKEINIRQWLSLSLRTGLQRTSQVFKGDETTHDCRWSPGDGGVSSRRKRSGLFPTSALHADRMGTLIISIQGSPMHISKHKN